MAGVEQDYVESANWYCKAAEQDHHAAQLYLGVYLAQGQGVEQNVVEGLKWILLAKRGGVWDRHAANETQGRLEALMSEQQIAEARVMALIFAEDRGE
jgi:TPR repeat protein